MKTSIQRILLAPLLMLLTNCGGTDKSSISDAPEVYLNHLYRVVDSVTYAEISQSDFINQEFAVREMRTTVGSNGKSWSGLYLYGDNNYIEFFDERSRKQTTTGLAFGVEEVGGIERVRENLKVNFGREFDKILQDRKIDTQTVPWFYYTGVVPDYDGETDLISWVMEYHPEFLEQWYPDLSEASPTIDRSNILMRYKAKVADKEAQDGYFKDVLSVDIGLPKNLLDRFINELESFNYKITKLGSDYVCNGPNIDFNISQVPKEEAGIQKLKISLNKPKEGIKEYTFGKKSKLTFYDDMTAVWSF